MQWQISGGRWAIIAAALTGLLLVYLLQKDITWLLAGLGLSKFQLFATTKTIRFLLNDLLMILLIHGIFYKKTYTLFAFYVQLFGIVFILAPYLIIKYHYTAYNGPLISYLHRLVVNPLLMLLVIPAFIYKQEVKE